MSDFDYDRPYPCACCGKMTTNYRCGRCANGDYDNALDSLHSQLAEANAAREKAESERDAARGECREREKGQLAAAAALGEAEARYGAMKRERDAAVGAVCRAKEAAKQERSDEDDAVAAILGALSGTDEVPCPHKERVKALEEAATVGDHLAAYAAAINWDGSPNTKDYLDGLRPLILDMQAKCEALSIDYRRPSSGVTK